MRPANPREPLRHEGHEEAEKKDSGLCAQLQLPYLYQNLDVGGTSSPNGRIPNDPALFREKWGFQFGTVAPR